MSTSRIQILTHIKAHPEREAELKTLLQRIVNQCNQEAGCNRCQILQHQIYSSDFVLVEEWEAAARLQADLTSPYLEQIIWEGLGLLAEDPSTNWYDLV
jgi:quinol monooxygenase YgiN